MITIEFTPFESNNLAQITTTATVREAATKEVLWTEPVIVNITTDMTAEQVQEAVKQMTSGFAARAEAIFAARAFVGIVPILQD